MREPKDFAEGIAHEFYAREKCFHCGGFIVGANPPPGYEPPSWQYPTDCLRCFREREAMWRERGYGDLLDARTEQALDELVPDA